MAESLKIASFNCKNVKTSVNEIKLLCESHDIVFLQETWLAADDLISLKNIDNSFYADGISAMPVDKSILVGRPYGGLGILWRKSFGNSVKVLKFDNETDRIMGLLFEWNNQKLLFLNVYMPYDDRNNGENYECFLSHLGLLHSIVTEIDTSCVYILGDWNASVHKNSSFGNELKAFCSDHTYVLSDVIFLDDGNHFTFFSDSHATTSWIDHCVSTIQGHNSISDVNILYDFHTSDHFPLCVCINVNNLPHFELDHDTFAGRCKWHAAKPSHLESYRVKCDNLLKTLVVPNELLHCSDVNCNDSNHCNDINLLYDNIVNSLSEAADNSIPQSNNKSHFNVPGWNDFVKTAHDEARSAFKLWISF